MRRKLLFIATLTGIALCCVVLSTPVVAQTYVGSQVCMTCHNTTNSNLGYNIWEEFMKTGHPYKLNKVNGKPPTYPQNTSPGVPNPPAGTQWSEFSYVIGGYGWKARFIKLDGKIYTTTDKVQYNLEDGSWVAYHFGEDKPYNYNCFQCHTTGPESTGSWNQQTAGLGTFKEPGIRCEGCHGPGSDHVADPTNVKPPNQGSVLKYDRCGDCHQRGGKTNAIPASGGFIRHHEQFNEMKASKHGDGNGTDLTCASCHDVHIAGRYPQAASTGLKAIKTDCATCHPNHMITVNGKPKPIACADCHMPDASKSAIGKQVGNGWRGDVATHIWQINTNPVPKDSMFTPDGKAVALDKNGLAAVTLDFACLRCHQQKDVQWASKYAKGIHKNGIVTQPAYVGSQKCATCHNVVNSNTGYNIWEEYMKTGHPYKLNKVSGGPPTYPANTSPGVPNPPPGTQWDAFSYVIGGYGWKARFVKKDGNVFTATQEVQYNLEDGSWVAYHFGDTKPYNYNCFQCHTTGPNATGSWNQQTSGLGTFSEPGIRCEGCHGPGADHVADPTNVKPPIVGTDLKFERCGDCHQRGGKTSAIPVSGGYIRHHEQFNEMKASRHGDLKLTCSTCHDVHIPLRYAKAAGSGLKGIKTECTSCHPNKQITIDGQPKNIECMDCHMPDAGKSAIGKQVGNGWRGDVATHLWKINTAPVTKDSMWSADGKTVRLDNDGHGAVTLDFACLKCHKDKTVEWASNYAKDIHEGISTDVDLTGMPESFELSQNYPNPFNPSTTIEYRLPERCSVLLEILDIYGRTVRTLVNDQEVPGTHRVTFDASGLESGLYLYRLTAGNVILTRKMLLVK